MPNLRPAAALVLAREGSNGPPELLMIRRPPGMRFLGGFHAFPGGAVEPRDTSDEIAELCTLSPEEAQAMVGQEHEVSSLSFMVCAVRETFEEIGVLLAQGQVPEPAALREPRARVRSGGSFSEELQALDLHLAVDRMRFHSRWTAPEALPVRFDAMVFIAAYDGPIDPHPDEVDDATWMTASTCLALAESGEVMLAPPTSATLTLIARAGSLEELIEGVGAVEAAEIESHSPLVRRLVAPNAGLMTGPGTNTYLVGGRDGVVVIDPASMEPAHLAAIGSGGNVALIVVTHSHPDHVSGALDLSQATGAPIAASWRMWQADRLSGQGIELREGDVVSGSGVEMRVLETPGHCSDHICLWMASERALFAGDLVLGQGTTVISPPDGDMAAYLDSLHKVAALGPEVIYPGHFEPRTDARELIGFYISHRLEREEQLIAAMRQGDTTIDQMVRRVYADYPEALHPFAARSVRAHLDKLIEEGRVLRIDDGFTHA